ncbi:MAG: 23S rRNA (pseudouridine(1915)-N(3))-methyltransferase RlmH, partial [Rickettsiales bacterium]|nr:23S rRNA (pseudouridine(1915)-N(3))-methyltransferase RlmH [Rickettsiales bacterium]
TREGERLLSAVQNMRRLVVLDEKGKGLGTQELAETIGNWRADGETPIGFIIGGPDGLDESVRKKADLVLSFGRLTWPHMLVRAMLVEQIYRVWSVLEGHPYHREG